MGWESGLLRGMSVELDGTPVLTNKQVEPSKNITQCISLSTTCMCSTLQQAHWIAQGTYEFQSFNTDLAAASKSGIPPTLAHRQTVLEDDKSHHFLNVLVNQYTAPAVYIPLQTKNANTSPFLSLPSRLARCAKNSVTDEYVGRE